MRHLLLATVAIMSLATGETVLAASGMPQENTDRRSQVAASGLPQQNTDRQSQLAAAPAGDAQVQANSNWYDTRLAASGLDYVRRSHGDA
jgi:hypothetical protein